ncbi:putative holin-like toxin [Leuconostoc mesenteroides]|nr:putative holin-like toxin [Leuconostoc mesenteroides]
MSISDALLVMFAFGGFIISILTCVVLLIEKIRKKIIVILLKITII